MTMTEALSRLRFILDESSAGFWSDADLYDMLDQGQEAVIDYCIRSERVRSKIEKLYRHPTLEPLITKVTTNIVSGQADYTFSTMSITNFRESYSLTLLYAGSQATRATRISKNELNSRDSNTYAVASTNSPAYAVEPAQITIRPIPSANSAGGVIFEYYKNPASVTSLADFTLRAETHEAIIYKAAALATEKDGELNASQLFEQKFNQILSQL